MSEAEQLILHACRHNVFRTRAVWGMRNNVALGGFKDPNPRVPCAVIDLERTNPHPGIYGMYVPIVLASGNTWEEVLAALKEAKQL